MALVWEFRITNCVFFFNLALYFLFTFRLLLRPSSVLTASPSRFLFLDSLIFAIFFRPRSPLGYFGVLLL